jgi:hypothetical protein
VLICMHVCVCIYLWSEGGGAHFSTAQFVVAIWHVRLTCGIFIVVVALAPQVQIPMGAIATNTIIIIIIIRYPFVICII